MDTNGVLRRYVVFKNGNRAHAWRGAVSLFESDDLNMAKRAFVNHSFYDAKPRYRVWDREEQKVVYDNVLKDQYKLSTEFYEEQKQKDIAEAEKSAHELDHP